MNPNENYPNLKGQVAIVTGGGRGLGQAFAQALASAGALVAVVSRSEDQLHDTVASITVAGRHAMAISLDVTDQEAVEHMITEVEERLGPVDLLINNAGVNTPIGSIAEVDPDQWWRCIEINVRGPFLCARAVLSRMLPRRRGRIINIGSTAGLRGAPGYSAYMMSKAALMRFSEILAAETKPHNISVFTMDPGWIRTAMTENMLVSPEWNKRRPGFREYFESLEVPLTDVVKLGLVLATGRADSLTGRFLQISDIEALIEHAEEIVQEDLYTLRLQRLST
jgi:NAD(P)-dependent dehydrogenase (short-subunit alcohol dehydrogenase family)